MKITMVTSWFIWNQPQHHYDHSPS